ncbi:MAG: DUF4870 domain-containing protein [Verrucomicrobia bacterium]|nr:DUF4870 domain-containing protein [Verrucomicrobiota bacterium]MBI3868014.1 DUF4870 domain-containing protein [Verrucomicrobiota bacterium]
MTTSSLTPPTVLSTQEKLWIVLSHLSVLFGAGLLLPLIVYLVKKDDSRVIAFHSKEALNFHLSIALYGLVCVPLIFLFVGVPMLMLLGIATFILSIVAAVKGADGREYRYPLTVRFIS